MFVFHSRYMVMKMLYGMINWDVGLGIYLPSACAKAMTTSWHVVFSVTPQTMRWTPSTNTFTSILKENKSALCFFSKHFCTSRTSHSSNKISLPVRKKWFYKFLYSAVQIAEFTKSDYCTIHYEGCAVTLPVLMVRRFLQLTRIKS